MVYRTVQCEIETREVEGCVSMCGPGNFWETIWIFQIGVECIRLRSHALKSIVGDDDSK